MVDSVTMEISGLKELSDKLLTMGKDLTRKAVRSGVKAAAEIVRDDARARNPDLTGRTEAAIYYKRIKKESTDFKQTYTIGVRTRGKKGAIYWRQVEFGNKFQPARPFLRPAFEVNKNKLVDVIREKIAKKIKAYDRKQARLSR